MRSVCRKLPVVTFVLAGLVPSACHSAHAAPSVTPHFSLNIRRSDTAVAGDIDLSSAIPLTAGPRVVVAKIDRADGRLTSVIAQVH